MKQKSIIFTVIIAILLFVTSCKPAPDGEISNGRAAINIVANSGAVTEESVERVIGAVYENTGITPVRKTDSSEVSPCEIVIGKSERDVSLKAYTLLSRVNYETETTKGYLIYSDGSSVAIAYDAEFLGKNFAEELAIEYFIQNYFNNGALELTANHRYLYTFDYIEHQEKLDAIYKAERWEDAKIDLTSMYGKESAETIISALQDFHSYFADGVESWIANLYAPEIGGFYYSNSARNTMGFLPDIESTYFALNFLKSSGMMTSTSTGIGYDYDEVFFEKTLNQIKAWVKGLQDPDSGYFYHPQWGKEFTDTMHSRRGRDLRFAVMILKNMCGSAPTYDTPQGDKGDGILPDGSSVIGVSATKVTTPISESAVSAVSRVIAVNDEDANVSPHLRSAEAFYEYLEGLNVNEDSYTAGNTLESQASQLVYRDKVLKARGEDYSLCEIMVNYLTEKQNKNTGLWTLEDEVTYDGVNGLLKIGNAIDGVGYAMPNMDKAVFSAIEAIRFTEPITVCYVLNPWYTLRTMYDNAENHGVTPEVKAAMDSAKNYIVKNAEELIRVTAENTMKFQKPDGSFSFNVDMTTHLGQGMLVAVQGTNEGDLNATNICVNAVLSGIYGTLGIHGVTVLSEAHLLKFISIVEGLGVAIKDKELVAEIIDFDDEDVGSFPIDMSQTINSSGYSKIVSAPSDSENKYIEFVSYADGAGKGADAIVFEKGKTLKPNANCYVWQVDMRYVSGSDHSAQIVCGYNLYMLGLAIKNGKIYFMDETSTGSDNIKVDHGVTVDVGEWFNLRVEYYKGDHSSVRIKVYINGVLTAVTDNYFGKKIDEIGTPRATFSHLTFRIFSNKAGVVNFDNFVSYATNSLYESAAKEDVYLNVEAEGSGVDHIYTFDEGAELPKEFDTSCAEGDSVAVTDDGKLLISCDGASEISIPTNRKDALAGCTRLMADVFVNESTEVGSVLKLDFMVNTYLTQRMITLHLVVCSDENGKYLTVNNANDNNTYDAIRDVRLPVGESFNLCIEFYAKTNETLIFLGGKIAGSTDVISASVDVDNLITNVIVSKIGTGHLEIAFDNIICELIDRTLEEAVPTVKDRIEYDFEKEGPDISLVGEAEISEGKLVLTEGGSAFVSVNERVTVVKTAVLKFNIVHSNNKDTGYSIALINSSGMTVGKLNFINSDGKILIYEEDERGLYPNYCGEFIPDSQGYTLIFEYAVNDSAINVYIVDTDGEKHCVVRTGALFSTDDKSAKYFRVSSISNAEIKLDALYAETAFDSTDTKALVEFETPDFNENGAIDFEYSTIGKIPSSVVTYFTYGGNISILGETTEDSINKVLKFVSKGKDQITISNFTKTAEKYNAIAYELKMSLTNDGGTAGKYYIIVAKKEIAIRISGGEVVITDPSPNAVTHSTGIAVGEWFTLRIEYFKDSSTKTVGYIYKVNGNVIGYDITDYDYSSMVDPSGVSNVYFRGDSRQGLFTMLMDDIVLEQFNYDPADIKIDDTQQPEPDPKPEPEPEPEPEPDLYPENPEITSPDAPLTPGENYGNSEWTQ